MIHTAHTLPIRDAFQEGWRQTRDNVRAYVTLGLVNLLLTVALQNTMALNPGQTPRPLLGLVLQGMQLCLWLVYLRFALALHDGRALGSVADRGLLRGLLFFAATALLYGLIVGVGLILLVFPGVLWGLRYAFAVPLSVDRDLDPLAALRESKLLTRDVKLPLLGFIVLCILLNALGGSLMGLGLIITVPVTFGAQVFLLRHLQGVTPQSGAHTHPPAAPAPSPA